MLFPVRCFSCHDFNLRFYIDYMTMTQVDGVSPKDALDGLGIKRDCCRKNFITHSNSLFNVVRGGFLQESANISVAR